MTVSGSRGLHADTPWRVFLALWPSTAAARQLAALANQLHGACGGRKIPQANQHMTLAFLGNLAPERVAGIAGALQRAAGTSFELHLDAVEYHKRGGMWWIRATQVDPELEGLVQRLREQSGALGLRVEHRRFVPHITLLRDARPCADWPTAIHVAWRAREMTLVRSNLLRSGAQYQVLHRVALEQRPGSA